VGSRAPEPLAPTIRIPWTLPSSRDCRISLQTASDAWVMRIQVFDSYGVERPGTKSA
jgi:hypothetical protein